MMDDPDMNAFESDDVLAELWQEGGEVRVEAVVPGVESRLGDLRSANRMNWWITVVCLALIVGFELATGFPNGPALLIATAAVTVATWFWYRWRERQLVDAYAEAGDILPFLIRRTRGARDFWALTAASPFLTVAGLMAWTRWVGPIGGDASGPGLTPVLTIILLAMIALLFAVEVYAIWVTVRATRELRVLRTMAEED